MTMGLVTQVALYEEEYGVRLRLLLPIVIFELLKWYQVCSTLLVCLVADHRILLQSSAMQGDSLCMSLQDFLSAEI